MQEDSKWLNDFYQEVNAGKRMELWQKHGCTEQTEGDTFREQLLYARYGKKKKKEVRSWLSQLITKRIWKKFVMLF